MLSKGQVFSLLALASVAGAGNWCCGGSREVDAAASGGSAVPSDDATRGNSVTEAEGNSSSDAPASALQADGDRGAEGAPEGVSVATNGAPEVDDGAGAGMEGAQSGAGESGAAPGSDESGAVGGSGTGSTFHVFLLLGQSNMAGYPKAHAEDRAEDPRVRVLGFDDCAATGRRTDEWDVAAPPLHECWNDGLGPGDYFAKTLLDVIPAGDSIGLVPCAISGERIETFLKVGGTRYDYIVRRARLAQEAGGVIEGLLFHQGESNSGDPSWPGKVNTLVTDLRTDLAIGNVPFLAGELLYTGGTAGHNTQVHRLPDIVQNAHVISAEGLVVDPADTQWNLHFDRDSQVEFGRRYARQLIELLGW